MAWDFAEANPFSDSGGNFEKNASYVVKGIQYLPSLGKGEALQVDASSINTAHGRVISTDPPYYDNIGYADLSDYFYVWLRRALRPVFPDLFATLAVPKTEELVATPYRHGGKEQAERFFMEGMTRALRNLAAQAHPAFPVTIYYAYKQQEVREEQSAKSEQSKKSAKSAKSAKSEQSEQSEQSASLDHTSHSSLLSPHSSTGWETFLEAVIQAGFAISGTWPMRTELGNRMLGQGTNALASSIVLVCRPRPANAPTVTRRDFVAALRAELPAALKAMQRGSIAPVDLAQAAIGPGMAVFTRYGKVLDAGGAPLSVREALALINAALDEALAEQEGDFDAETRWALAWFEQHGFGEGEFGVAETLSKAKNTSVEGLAGAGMVAAKRGKVRLLKPAELAPDWDPSGDARVTHWKGVHSLIRALERGGETAAAELAAKLGSQADVARELAYRLYAICERKKRPAEAWSYNALAQSWPELARLAAQRGAAVQSSMFTAEYAEERRGQE